MPFTRLYWLTLINRYKRCGIVFNLFTDTDMTQLCKKKCHLKPLSSLWRQNKCININLSDFKLLCICTHSILNPQTWNILRCTRLCNVQVYCLLSIVKMTDVFWPFWDFTQYNIFSVFMRNAVIIFFCCSYNIHTFCVQVYNIHSSSEITKLGFISNYFNQARKTV